ncbi:hypothetical protein E3T35_06105 [Cryobacterium sp. TMT1-2-2]|uniref:hypothetical protein n=1 Tax=Cryobacterium sp. TMT1-2-2 TaxID=1259233 RepID=UPI00106A780A|nr:hypothetical protein [Cryobacterium sp. TMT1-2-2]TFD12858.1 hypothetical protein E3T35_06105 [Cryobacterium sp. TMT1-2-2]
MNNSLGDGSDGTNSTSATEPVSYEDDGEFRHLDAWNSYQFDPPLTHTDALKLVSHADELGYRMLFRRADYSIEQIQQQLVDRGPGSFLNMVWLQEDVSPKEPPKTAEQRMAGRLQGLAPIGELVITDPYLYTSSRKRDSQDYAASVARMLSPALKDGLRLTTVVSPSQNDETVRTAVLEHLHAQGRDLEVNVVESNDFHDRFWIADRKRGLIIGTSLNKIGSRIFFVDELSQSDVAAVLAEVDTIVGSTE